MLHLFGCSPFIGQSLLFLPTMFCLHPLQIALEVADLFLQLSNMLQQLLVTVGEHCLSLLLLTTQMVQFFLEPLLYLDVFFVAVVDFADDPFQLRQFSLRFCSLLFGCLLTALVLLQQVVVLIQLGYSSTDLLLLGLQLHQGFMQFELQGGGFGFLFLQFEHAGREACSDLNEFLLDLLLVLEDEEYLLGLLFQNGDVLLQLLLSSCEFLH